MKKQKIIIPVIFIFVFSVCSFASKVPDYNDEGVTPSFFINEDKSVTLWGTDNYEYAGDLSEEKIKVTSSYVPGEIKYDEDTGEEYDTSEAGMHCFGLKPEKTGYYIINLYSDDEIPGKCFVYKNENDKTEGIFRESNYIYDDNNKINGVIIKTVADEYTYVFVDEWKRGKYEISAEFLGKEITDMKADGPLLTNCGFDSYIATEEENGIDGTNLYPYINITFSGNKTVKIKTYAYSPEKAEPGSTITGDFMIFNEEYKIPFSFINRNELVKDISLPENFRPSCTVSYDYCDKDYSYPDYLILTLADGTELKIENSEFIKLSNGRSYDAYMGYEGNGDGEEYKKPVFSYSLAGVIEKNADCDIKCEGIFSTIKEIFNLSEINFRYAVNIFKGNVEDSSKTEIFYLIPDFFRNIIRAVKFYNFYGEPVKGIITAAIFTVPVIILLAAAVIIIKNKKGKSKNHDS